MTIAQRGSSTTGITGDTFGACDRWELDLSGAGTWTMEQVGDAPHNTGFTHCSSLSCTSAATTVSSHLSMRQKIEACNIKSLMGGTPNAKPLTVSFWVKSNEPGKYYVTLYRNRTGTDSSRISISYTIEQSEVWEFKTITYPPDTLNGYGTTLNSTGLEIHFALGYDQNNFGSAHYGQWSINTAYLGKGQTNLAAATGNYWRVTGVQLEIGNEHTEFDQRPFQEELALCQRYFETINLYGANTTFTGGGYNRHIGEVFWKVEKRAIPTTNTPSVGNYQPGGGTGTVTISGPTIHGGVLNSGNTNQTYPDGWINGGSILKIDAEL